MTNVTSLSKRPYLTKETVFKNMSDKIGSSDKVIMAGLKADGTVEVYSTNNMTPAEELFMATCVYDGAVKMAMMDSNTDKFSDEVWD